jgi:hypothetical protein
VSGNGVRKPPRPQIELLSPADPQEAAAVVAALEQFLADTAPAPTQRPSASPWQQAALLEGVSGKQAFGPNHTTGPERRSPWLL